MGYRHEGKTIYYSTARIIEMMNAASRGLLALGLKPGDKIATVIVKNRPEWVILDMAMMQIGVQNVPVYPTISAREYEYIFKEAEVSLCFIGDDQEGSLRKKIEGIRENVASLKEVYMFDKASGGHYWEEMFSSEGAEEVERIKLTIRPDDLATIIYTSGTTGQPKGVMLSHDNIMSNIIAVMDIIPVLPDYRILSFLPLNHIFERVASCAMIYRFASVVFTGVDNLGGEGGDLKAVQPHFFTCVPRLLEKVYERIYNTGLGLTGVKRRLFFWALDFADGYEYDKEYTGFSAIKKSIADKLVFSKWRAALGGNIKGIVVGASPCPVKIARIFSFARIPVREGYGMTETSPGISIGRFEKGQALLGTIGPVIDRVEVMIDSSEGDYRTGEGEILCAGPNVMLGYYKQPEKTAEVIKYIDGKRYICTGDIGTFVEKGGVRFLKITDRKKELLKTSNGKYVAPAPIENKLKESFLVEQAMVVGDNEKFVSALIVPAPEALRDWCVHKGITWTNLKDMIGNVKVLEKFQEIVNEYNPLFSHVEQIKKILLVPDAWETVKVDGSQGELTPTMKLKRRSEERRVGKEC